MKTLLMSVSDGYHVKHLLRSEVFKFLKEEARIVVLSLQAGDPAFRAEFERENVAVEPLADYRPGWLERKTITIRNNALANRKLTGTLCFKFEKMRRENPLRYFLLHDIMNNALGRSKTAFELFRGAENRLFPDKHYAELFKKYKPDAALLSTPGFKTPDIPLLRRCRAAGVPAISAILSWDNLTSKGSMPIAPRRLIVWNEIMKREAVELHGYNPEHVHIAGAPHFDPYFRREGLLGREEFFKNMGLDPGKKLITYTTVPQTTCGYQGDFISIVLEAVNAGTLGPAQLLVRLHPQDEEAAYSKFRSTPGLVFDLPGRYTRQFDSTPASLKAMFWDPSLKDVLHLGDTMLHSDAVICIASTITIEAAIFDTPVINLAFDGDMRLPKYNSLLRYYDYTHYKNVAESGGAAIVKSREEFTSALAAYIKDPSLHREGRRKIIASQCSFDDGASARRLARSVLDFMDDPGQ